MPPTDLGDTVARTYSLLETRLRRLEYTLGPPEDVPASAGGGAAPASLASRLKKVEAMVRTSLAGAPELKLLFTLYNAHPRLFRAREAARPDRLDLPDLPRRTGRRPAPIDLPDPVTAANIILAEDAAVGSRLARTDGPADPSDSSALDGDAGAGSHSAFAFARMSLTVAATDEAADDLANTEAVCGLACLGPRAAAVAAEIDGQAAEIAGLRERQCRLLKRWQDVSVVGMGESWVGWEEVLSEADIKLRRIEQALKTEQ